MVAYKTIVQNYEGFVFSYESFFRCMELNIGFVKDGSHRVPAIRSV
jgi:hypothetical protein